MNITRFHRFLNEGRNKYDSMSRTIVSKIIKKWAVDYKTGSFETVDNVWNMSYCSITIEKILSFDVEARMFFTDKVEGFEVLPSTGATADDGDDAYILIDFAINPEWLPQYWSEIYMILSDVIRHEIEHITQGGPNYRKGKPTGDDTELRKDIENSQERYKYYTLPLEIDANLQGLRYEAKKRKEDIKTTINRFLDIQDFTPEQKERILDIWRKRAKKIGGIPEF
jgi:hypothetical protein